MAASFRSDPAPFLPTQTAIKKRIPAPWARLRRDNIDTRQVEPGSRVYNSLSSTAPDDVKTTRKALATFQALDPIRLLRVIIAPGFSGVHTMKKGEIYIFGFRGFPDVQGGIETHVENLAPQLAQMGHRITACVRSPYVDKQHKEWKGVRLLRLWTVRNAYFETLLHSLICALVAGVRRPDVVHIHGIGPALVVPLLRMFGLRVIVTHHGEDYNREKWGWAARTLLRLGEALGMRFAHQRIVISRSIEKVVTGKYGKSCEVIPNGVVFADPPREADKVVELGLEPGRYVLTVGRLVPEKRQLDLLRAFNDARLSGWKLAIVGRIDHKNRYADHLASEAALAKDVVMAGFQTGTSLRQLYAHAGLFVLPSSHEGLPIALLEALSYGLPVLVSDIPSNMEVVSDTNRVFRMGSIAELSTKIRGLSAMNLNASGREAVRLSCARRYNWAEIAQKTSAAYDELVNSKSGIVVPRLNSSPRYKT